MSPAWHSGMETVANILSEKGARVHCVDANATVHDAVAKMAKHDIGALVVIENGRGTGILAERDALHALALQGMDARATRVNEIASRVVVTVDPLTSVDRCMTLMTHYRTRHLPVIAGTELCGIVSIGDVVKYRMREQQFDVQHLIAYIQGEVITYRVS